MSEPSPTPAAPPPFKPGLISRSIAAFSGLPGLVIKMALLAISNGLAVWAAYVLADQHHWVALPILVAATLAVDFFYLAPAQLDACRRSS